MFRYSVEECISERESRRFEEGLIIKVKLDIYKQFECRILSLGEYTWSE